MPTRNKPLFAPDSLQPYADTLATTPDPVVSGVAPREPGIGFGPHLALLLGQGADVGTTLYGWQHGQQESNPHIGMSPAKLAAMKAAGLGLTELLMHILKDKYPTAAKAVGYTGGIIGGAAAVHNVAQGYSQ